MTLRKMLAAIGFCLALPGGAGALTYCVADDPKGFDPAQHTDRATLEVASRQIYDRLVEFDRTTMRIVPGLAESWAITNRGRTYTFTLRDDVVFHSTEDFTPSRKMNASDVVFSFQRQRLKNHRYYSQSRWPYFRAMGGHDLIRSVERLSRRKVRFRLHRASADFLPFLAMDFAAILSDEYSDTLSSRGEKERLDTHPVGTGPFMVSRNGPGQVEMSRFDAHWRGPARTATASVVTIPDDEERLAAVASGRCDLASPIAPGTPAPDGVRIKERDGLSLAYLAFDTTTPPFDNADLRRALGMAINREALAQTALGAKGAPLSPLSRAFWAYQPQPYALPFDTETAARLVGAAGAAETRVELWIPPVARTYAPDPSAMADAIAADLAEIGVTIDIRQPDWGRFLSETLKGDRRALVLFGWTANAGNPARLFGQLTCDARGKANRANWCNEAFDAALAKAHATTDPEAQTAAYHEAQAILMTEVPIIPLATTRWRVPTHPDLKGFSVSPTGLPGFFEASRQN